MGDGEYSGDGGPATSASLKEPFDIAIESNTSSLYIADTGSDRIRMVFANGTIVTVAGNGSREYSDDVPSTSTGLNKPYGVAVSSSGELYIFDQPQSYM